MYANKHVAIFIKLVSRESLSRWLIQKNKRPEKCLIAELYQLSDGPKNIFFAPNSPLLGKSSGKKKKKKQWRKEEEERQLKSVLPFKETQKSQSCFIW